MSRANTHKLITKLLLIAGIPSRCDGYYYLRQSIELCVLDRDALRQVTKRLYPEVGVANGVSAAAVERAIRTAISAAWDKGKMKNLENEIGVDNLFAFRPTAGEFIGIIVECICSGITA